MFSFYLKQQKKLYDDIFAFICHIRHCTSCDVTNIAISMLKRHIVKPQLSVQNYIVLSSSHLYEVSYHCQLTANKNMTHIKSWHASQRPRGMTVCLCIRLYLYLHLWLGVYKSCSKTHVTFTQNYSIIHYVTSKMMTRVFDITGPPFWKQHGTQKSSGYKMILVKTRPVLLVI